MKAAYLIKKVIKLGQPKAMSMSDVLTFDVREHKSRAEDIDKSDIRNKKKMSDVGFADVGYKILELRI